MSTGNNFAGLLLVACRLALAASRGKSFRAVGSRRWRRGVPQGGPGPQAARREEIQSCACLARALKSTLE